MSVLIVIVFIIAAITMTLRRHRLQAAFVRDAGKNAI